VRERTGEKLGWVGGFLWVLVLSIVWLFRGQVFPAIPGALLVSSAAAGAESVVGVPPAAAFPTLRNRGEEDVE
jgi:hypothetical protein